jgi:hypothetical protein
VDADWARREFNGPVVPLPLMLGGLKLANQLNDSEFQPLVKSPVLLLPQNYYYIDIANTASMSVYIRSGDGDQVYIYPKLKSAENGGFWGAEGSHMHFVFDPPDNKGQFKALRAVMTVRHKDDVRISSGSFHFAVSPAPYFDRSMTRQIWNEAIDWWCAQPAPVGNAWRQLSVDEAAKKRHFDYWQTLLDDTLQVCNIWFGNKSWSYDE